MFCRGESKLTVFPVGPVIKYFVIPPNSKVEQLQKITVLTQAGTQICRGFKVHDLITCESKVQVVVFLGC